MIDCHWIFDALSLENWERSLRFLRAAIAVPRNPLCIHGFRLQGSPCRRQDFSECLIGPATPDFLVASAIRQAMKFRYAVAGMAVALVLAALIMARDLGLFR